MIIYELKVIEVRNMKLNTLYIYFNVVSREFNITVNNLSSGLKIMISNCVYYIRTFYTYFVA